MSAITTVPTALLAVHAEYVTLGATVERDCLQGRNGFAAAERSNRLDYLGEKLAKFGIVV